MPRLSKIGAAALAAFGWSTGSSVTATYLQVAGGGGGGGSFTNTNGDGGGGGGGYLSGTVSLNPASSYAVTVGAGGAGGNGAGVGQGTSGSNSLLSAVTTTSIGGGGGGGSTGANAYRNGLSGGSGGGAASYSGLGSVGAGTAGQGNNGGNANSSSGNYPGGGGGGAGSVGGDATTTVGGSGGVGLANSISGTSTYYAGGGGGGCYSTGGTPGAGGNGGGGAGNSNGGAGYSATSNTGGGGGGAGSTSATTSTGGNGGSGIVIISYPAPQKFGGGVVTTSGSNVIHTFTTSGTLSPLSSLTASYLIVAGGGGGGFDSNGSAGGGGAGGMLTGSGITIDTNSTYLVTVGSGGAGASTSGIASGSSGTNSSFSLVPTIAIGGGYGGARASGGAGGSGGGACDGTNGAGNLGGAGTTGQGNAGGTAVSGSYAGACGGGGAGAVGANNTGGPNVGGNGGNGLQSSISGTATYYAGGGGGGGYNGGSTRGTGGLGGGGNGNNNGNGTPGTANTGGGGGGGSSGNPTGIGAGQAGGSGIVIISYAGSVQQMAGGTVTIVGGNVIHTFTSSGYLAPLKYVGNSLRFRSSASAYLNRTFGAGTSDQKFTISAWVKRGALGATSCIMSNANSIPGSNEAQFVFTNTDNLRFYTSGGTYSVITTQVFRDPSAWYHLVCQVDVTQATAANRVIMYVNGVQITSYGTANYPPQNTNIGFNNAYAHGIGAYVATPTQFFDGYIAELNFIDGQALTPNSFGTFNSYGVWQPITYGGSYGTNGFYLPFTNKTSTTTLGYDFSPNGNNWTTNNISLTAGSTYDSMTDVPTLTSTTAANYCVLNPIMNYGTAPAVITNGNLTATSNSSSSYGASLLGTMAVSSGKWYWEFVVSSSIVTGSKVGIVGTNYNPNFQNDAYFTYYASGYGYQSNGQKQNNNSYASYGATYTNGDVIGVAFDADGGTITFYKNGTSQGQAYSGISGTFFPAIYGYTSSVMNINFGQQPFVYTPPTGFVALNTYNL